MAEICCLKAHKTNYMMARVNPKVNYRRWVIVMCQCRFIFGKKRTILVSDVDNGGGMHVWGQGVHGKSLYLSLNLLVNLKLLLKSM